MELEMNLTITPQGKLTALVWKLPDMLSPVLRHRCAIAAPLALASVGQLVYG
jgi:hypothetical protein